MLTGYKTLLLNGLLAAGAAVLHYIVGADLSAVDPAVSVLLIAAANFGLRFLTKTPVGG